MKVEVVTDPACMADLAEEWMALWERDPAATPFHTPDYAHAAWETELGADRSFVSIQMRRDGTLAGLANLTIEPDGTLRFLGNASVTDYLGPIAAEPDREQVADLFVTTIEGMTAWERAELLCLADDAGWVEPIARSARARGFGVARSQHDVCPRVAIPGDFDAYLGSISSKLRHEIRRKARRLARDTGGFTTRLSDEQTLAEDLRCFYGMHRSSDGPKGHFLYEEMAALFTRIAEAFLARGWLRLVWLEVAGEPWAAVLAFATRGTWNVYNSAYDHSKREHAPGMVLMGEAIRLASEEGAHTFDLLRGDEPYKYRFGAVDHPLSQLGLAREGQQVPALHTAAATLAREA